MKHLVYISFSVLLISCYSPRYVYSPSTQNIPSLSAKKDFTMAGFFAANAGGPHNVGNDPNTSLGLDLHTAYALTNHIALMANQYARWEKNENGNDYFSGDSLSIRYKRSLTEIGAGYFTPIANNSTILQIFAGTAFGKFRIHEKSIKSGSSFTRFHESGVTKLFIQPSLIAGIHRNFTAAFSLRFSAIMYHNIQTDYSAAELDDYFLSGISQSPVFFWEPAMNFTFGFKEIKKIKFQLQAGFSVLMNRRFVDYRSLNFGAGIVSDFLNHHTAKHSKN